MVYQLSDPALLIRGLEVPIVLADDLELLPPTRDRCERELLLGAARDDIWVDQDELAVLPLHEVVLLARGLHYQLTGL